MGANGKPIQTLTVQISSDIAGATRGMDQVRVSAGRLGQDLNRTSVAGNRWAQGMQRLQAAQDPWARGMENLRAQGVGVRQTLGGLESSSGRTTLAIKKAASGMSGFGIALRAAGVQTKGMASGFGTLLSAMSPVTLAVVALGAAASVVVKHFKEQREAHKEVAKAALEHREALLKLTEAGRKQAEQERLAERQRVAGRLREVQRQIVSFETQGLTAGTALLNEQFELTNQLRELNNEIAAERVEAAETEQKAYEKLTEAAGKAAVAVTDVFSRFGARPAGMTAEEAHRRAEEARRAPTGRELDQRAIEAGLRFQQAERERLQEEEREREVRINSFITGLNNAGLALGTFRDATLDAVAGVLQLASQLVGLLEGTGVLDFQGGGIVPGPRGRGRLAIVHGGEEVIPVGRARESAFVTNINFQVSAIDPQGVEQFFARNSTLIGREVARQADRSLGLRRRMRRS